MKLLSTVALASVMLGVSALAPKGDEVDLTYTFRQYVADHGKIYADAAEYAAHEKVFMKNLANIVEHNKRGATFKMGVNQFTDLATEDLKSYHGLDKHAMRQPNRGTTFKESGARNFVPTLDWQKNMPPVMNQGSCGSCYIFSSTAAAAAHLTAQTGTLYDLSVQQPLDCLINQNSCGGTGGCYGGTAQVVYDYFMTSNVGWEHSYAYPYMSFYNSYDPETYPCRAVPGASSTIQQSIATVTGYVNVANNSYWSMMEALQVGPVVINLDASSFHSYSSGVHTACDMSGNVDINHAVVLAGYGTDEDSGLKYWKVVNSWGTSWGENGVIRILRQEPGEQPCGIDSTPLDGTACAGETDPIQVCGSCGLLWGAAYPLVEPYHS